MNALSESVKCIVVLGHLGCGAVTGAVDSYLQPLKFWSKSNPPMLRTITTRIFVAVREAANGLRDVWGLEASSMPGYREALIDIAVCVNAAQAAFDLRLEVERAAKWEIEVFYGVFSLHNHQVSMPVNPRAPIDPVNVNLAYAPTEWRNCSDRRLPSQTTLAWILRCEQPAGAPQFCSRSTASTIIQTIQERGLASSDESLLHQAPPVS
jgi:hypothetical protein